MKRIIMAVGTIFCTVFFFAQSAFPWGWAVHTYIDEQFSTKWQIRNANQLYGGLTPDIFNYQFDAPALYMQGQTHNEFMKVWDAARSKPGKALAFGFVSHNEVWGVDSTAHRSGITFGQPGTRPGHPEAGGYVVAKAYILKGILEQIPEFNALQLPEPLALQVAHELVEYGVDILMKQIDPTIGAKISAAALPPNPNFPLLLEKAYAEEFAAHFGISYTDTLKFFASSERQFRQFMILYGQVLMQDDATAILLISQQLAELATAFLAANGLTLPPGADITPLLQFGIMQSMVLCAPDFAAEVFATSNFVDQQLAAHGITN
ncbi:MAG: hypothetical protein ACM3MD_10345 [Betaproteobacteria bacterium]